MQDIRLRFSKKENDIMVTWKKGCKGLSNYILDLFGKKFRKIIEENGYDIKSIKFSINRTSKSRKTNK